MPFRRNVLGIREDPRQGEGHFSDAGADKLLRGGQSRNRAVRDAPEGANALHAMDARHKVGEENRRSGRSEREGEPAAEQ